MKKLILAMVSVFLLSGCAVLKPDYSDYVIGVPNKTVSIANWTEEKSGSSTVYAESGVEGKYKYIVLLEDSANVSEHPTSDGRLTIFEAFKMSIGRTEKIKGVQSAQVPSGDLIIKFNWIVLNTGFTGGYKISFPQAVSFNAEVGQRYIIAAEGWPLAPKFYVKNLVTMKRVDAKFERPQ